MGPCLGATGSLGVMVALVTYSYNTGLIFLRPCHSGLPGEKSPRNASSDRAAPPGGSATPPGLARWSLLVGGKPALRMFFPLRPPANLGGSRKCGRTLPENAPAKCAGLAELVGPRLQRRVAEG